MKNKIDHLRGKKYLFLFIVVMIMNIALAGILLRSSMGQTRTDFSSQKPIKVEVIEQKESPLRITVVDVDNSGRVHQEIICSLQNVSDKSIRAYVLLADGQKSNRGGKIIIHYFSIKLFHAGESSTTSMPIERVNIQNDETISLSIDYVEFSDGSFWGADRERKSQTIAGERAGKKAGITYFRELIKNGDSVGITNSLRQDITEINVEVPDKNQTEEWKGGFQTGYRTVVSILQKITDQKAENLSKKLNELEKNVN